VVIEKWTAFFVRRFQLWKSSPETFEQEELRSVWIRQLGRGYWKAKFIDTLQAILSIGVKVRVWTEMTGLETSQASVSLPFQ
jgi:hypothetical protein